MTQTNRTTQSAAPLKAAMTDQDFAEFQATVEGSAVSYENREDGTTVVTCDDGVRLLVGPDGDSRQMDIRAVAQPKTQTEW